MMKMKKSHYQRDGRPDRSVYMLADTCTNTLYVDILWSVLSCGHMCMHVYVYMYTCTVVCRMHMLCQLFFSLANYHNLQFVYVMNIGNLTGTIKPTCTIC